MKFETTEKFGEVLKSHGKDGEIVISSDVELSEDFAKMESIFIDINGGLVPFFIEDILIRSSKTAILKLEDVENVGEANELSGRSWFLPKKEWDKLLQENPQTFSILKGYTLVDQNDEEIGSIEDIQEIPSNTLLQVRYGSSLIDVPINEATIYHIDQQKQTVKNHIPDGLLEL